MDRKAFSCCVIFVTFFLVGMVSGWGALGHQAIGQCAQSFLTPKAQAAVATLLHIFIFPFFLSLYFVYFS